MIGGLWTFNCIFIGFAAFPTKKDLSNHIHMNLVINNWLNDKKNIGQKKEKEKEKKESKQETFCELEKKFLASKKSHVFL